MKILVTGAKGFIGKNLISQLRNRGFDDIAEFDTDTPAAKLRQFAAECSFVFHLAGVNRPENVSEFASGNTGFTQKLLSAFKESGNKAPVLVSSSVQAELDNPYGISKRESENAVFDYGRENGVRTCVYRLSNVFGKWCRPNYNSVVATFCHNIANGLPVTVNDENAALRLHYIDDVVNEFINAIDGGENRNGEFCVVEKIHEITVGQLAQMLERFRRERETLGVPKVDGEFEKALFSTYLTYLPTENLATDLTPHCDARGSFTELFRTPERGQISVNVTNPGITKGNHWHHTKCEKFIAVAGSGVIRLRKLGTSDVIEHRISAVNMQSVDIPCGYTHSIVNDGTEPLITVIWCNECFDPDNPDTYFEEV